MPVLFLLLLSRVVGVFRICDNGISSKLIGNISGAMMTIMVDTYLSLVVRPVRNAGSRINND